MLVVRTGKSIFFEIDNSWKLETRLRERLFIKESIAIEVISDQVAEKMNSPLKSHSLSVIYRARIIISTTHFCRHDVVMTTREYAMGRRCIPRCIPCVFAL